MLRIFLAGVVAVALLLAGSVAVISWATRDPGAVMVPRAVGEPSGAPAAPALDPTPAMPAAALAPTAKPDERAEPAEPAEPAAARPPGPLATDGSAQRSAPERQQVRASFRGELRAGFSALQERVSACSAPGVSFTLSLEAVEGGVRILDATVESRGAVGEAEISCARSALRGQVVPAPSAEPGRRWQLPFSVRPAS